MYKMTSGSKITGDGGFVLQYRGPEILEYREEDKIACFEVIYDKEKDLSRVVLSHSHYWSVPEGQIITDKEILYIASRIKDAVVLYHGSYIVEV